MTQLSQTVGLIHLLAFTDLSDEARQSLHLLRPLVRQFQPHFTLVYVFPIPDTIRDQRTVLLWEDKIKTAGEALMNEQIHSALGDETSATVEARVGQIDHELRKEMKSGRYAMVLLLGGRGNLIHQIPPDVAQGSSSCETPVKVSEPAVP